MSNSENATSLSQAEKRFCDKVTERYLLTMKSGGIGDLLLLVTGEGHADDMWMAYNGHDGDGSSWIPRSQAAHLCRVTMAGLVDAVVVSIGGFEQDMYSLNEVGDADGYLKGAVRLAGGKCHWLKTLQPSCEYITRAI